MRRPSNLLRRVLKTQKDTRPRCYRCGKPINGQPLYDVDPKDKVRRPYHPRCVPTSFRDRMEVK